MVQHAASVDEAKLGASKLRSMVGGTALMVVDNNEEVWKLSKESADGC
jgi:hypothetical protein